MEDIMLVSIDIEYLSILFYMISIYYNKVQIPCHTHELFNTALSRTKSKEFSFKIYLEFSDEFENKCK